MYTLENIKEKSIIDNPVKYSRKIGGDKWRTHKLENTFTVRLSNGMYLNFNKGWEWDRSSVPQFLWGLLKPDGDDDIAYAIHDILYQNKGWRDPMQEMLRWAKKMKKTRRWSLRNLDIYTRYYAVRWFGWIVRNKGS